MAEKRKKRKGGEEVWGKVFEQGSPSHDGQWGRARLLVSLWKATNYGSWKYIPKQALASHSVHYYPSALSLYTGLPFRGASVSLV